MYVSGKINIASTLLYPSKTLKNVRALREYKIMLRADTKRSTLYFSASPPPVGAASQ